MNVAMASALGLVPLSDEEREAVRLYYKENADLRTISALTGLSTRAVRAVTDRVAATMLGRVNTAAERTDPPAAQPDRTPPRRRIVRAAALPLAHTAPTSVLPEPALPNIIPAAADIPAAPASQRPRSVQKPAPEPSPASNPHPAAAEFTPGTPAWTALATSPAVRRWAVADGWQVPGRGQPLPGAIVLAYLKAHPTGGAK